jgi:hypothetical protein
MGDFLISLNGYRGADLLGIMLRPYRENIPSGHAFDYTWGSAAVLTTPQTALNILRHEKNILAWVGDLVMTDPQRTALLHRAVALAQSPIALPSLTADDDFCKLNGAFAMFITFASGLAVIVDPLGLTVVYAGYDRNRRLTAIGTHADIVAAIADDVYDLDMVSIAEYLNRGAACFPYTMHANVRKLFPGSLNVVRCDPNSPAALETALYWQPPAELSQPRLPELIEQFDHSFTDAVKSRCASGKTAVALSGGLDSRLILAAVPCGADCLTMTFCDSVNREAKTAYRVARALKRPWLPLFRNREFIARSVVNNVRLSGCECDWIHGHAAAFAPQFTQQGVSSILSGYLMDTFLRGYFAKDLAVRRKWMGFADPTCHSIPYDWVRLCSDFCREYLSPSLHEQMIASRRSYFDTRFDSRRGSVVEWLDIYPFSQRPEAGTWMIERRKLPLRLPAMDRRLLDLSFSIPIAMRATGAFFHAASRARYGPAAVIANANNGISPASTRLARCAQRLIRKIHDACEEAHARCGSTIPVHHSWHDYQRYWATSPAISELLAANRAHLSQFEGLLFNEKISPAEPQKLHWRDGFRLLGLALWRAALTEYRMQVAKPVIRTPSDFTKESNTSA